MHEPRLQHIVTNVAALIRQLLRENAIVLLPFLSAHFAPVQTFLTKSRQNEKAPCSYDHYIFST